MKTTTLTLLLELAGIMHLGLIAAGLTMPRVVNLRSHLAPLPPFIRKLYWVYYSFIALFLVGFGSLSVTFAGTLANGGPLARALCFFLAAFWTLRLIVATFVFDVRPYLTSKAIRLGYCSTNIVFTYLPLVYLLAAWEGGAR